MTSKPYCRMNHKAGAIEVQNVCEKLGLDGVSPFNIAGKFA